jgi:hypothetical protein
MLSVAGIHADGPQPQQPPPFKRSDPALLNTTGTFQLLEFYHPT